jgi:Fe-S-cluster containining protein
MNNKNIYCHKGCNLCCHALTLTSDPLNTYILTRVFTSIPYNELFPYFKTCVDKRIKVQNYIDKLPLNNNNIITEVYNKFGFTPFTCPFVNEENGCLIYEFRPQQCFSYFSSVPCKIVFNPQLNEQQREIYGQTKDRAETVDICGLDNDHGNYNFNDIFLKNYNELDQKAIEQDNNLLYILAHSISYEMLTILSIALEMVDAEKYSNDMKGIKMDFFAHIDGEIKYL